MAMKRGEMFFLVFFHVMFAYLAVVTLVFEKNDLFKVWNFPLGVILIVVAAYYIIENIYMIRRRNSLVALYVFLLLIDLLFVYVMAVGVYSRL